MPPGESPAPAPATPAGASRVSTAISALRARVRQLRGMSGATVTRHDGTSRSGSAEDVHAASPSTSGTWGASRASTRGTSSPTGVGAGSAPALTTVDPPLDWFVAHVCGGGGSAGGAPVVSGARDDRARALRNLLARADRQRLQAVRDEPLSASAWLALLRETEASLAPGGLGPSSGGTLDHDEHQLLLRLYERATRSIPLRGNRRSAPYVQLWLRYVQVQQASAPPVDDEDIRDMFRYMKAERIGEHAPEVTEAWSAFERHAGNFKKAHKLAQEADAKRAAQQSIAERRALPLERPLRTALSPPEVTRREVRECSGPPTPPLQWPQLDAGGPAAERKEHPSEAMTPPPPPPPPRLELAWDLGMKEQVRSPVIVPTDRHCPPDERQQPSSPPPPTPSLAVGGNPLPAEAAPGAAGDAAIAAPTDVRAVRRPLVPLASTSPHPADKENAAPAATATPAPAPRRPAAGHTATAALTSAALHPLSHHDAVVHVAGNAYVKLEMVGRGGSSKVFKVMGAATRKIHALKRVRVRKGDSDSIRSYTNEIQLLLRLRGKENIIQLIGAEVREDAGLVYMVMEFGEIDLARLLQRGAGKPMNANFLRLYWQQMLEAVHTIHEERIVHSDLKPANFLFVEGVLKLIDFGIAKAIQNDTTNIVRDSQVGTLNYMSPEAILDTGDAGGGTAQERQRRRYKLGRASDIWSLGCILYQMVYGRTPFSHLNVIQKLHCITDPSYVIAFPPVDGIHGLAASSSGAFLLDTLQRCLQRDPARRATIPELLTHPFLNPDAVATAIAAESPAPALPPSLASSASSAVAKSAAAESRDLHRARVLHILQQLRGMNVALSDEALSDNALLDRLCAAVPPHPPPSPPRPDVSTKTRSRSAAGTPTGSSLTATHLPPPPPLPSMPTSPR